MQARNLRDAALRRPDPDREPGGSSLGCCLKTYFDELTQGPVPDRLQRLTEQLEAALERGELRCGGEAPRRR